ncbi:hypothetical protein E8E11_000352 [Didymella keratinophila]|nr:hypothetical protein E8E11_000352 [Didymella keratinophila]
MGMRFPFLIVETKGLSVHGNLVSAQNQAAISGASMLRILKDLEETTDSHPTSPPLCFSIVTEGPAHELWVHFEYEEAFHMEALKSWRMTRASDVEEFVRALVSIMEWGRGRFRDGILARLDSQPAVAGGLNREKYLADGSYSPMSEALSLLAYCKYVALAAGNSGNAYWSKDKKIFYLHGRRIYISRFCKMVQDMVSEAEQMLWEERFWVTRAEERFAVKLDMLVDDVTFERRGMSFVQHCDNGNSSP